MFNSLLRNLLRFALRYLVKPVNGPPLPVAVQRFWLRFMAFTHRPAPGISRVRTFINGVDIQDINAKQDQQLIIYAHGGAYYLGDVDTHVGLTTRMARDCQTRVWSVNYRLAPEHAHPAALQDMLTTYTAALKLYPADKIILAGDSAGGGLTLSTACAIRDKGLPQPAGLILISPWVDLTLIEAATLGDKFDPLLSWQFLRAGIKHYCPHTNPGDAAVSPLFADLTNLPAVLIQCGSQEILKGDSERLRQRLQHAGVKVDLEMAQGMWHVYPIHAGTLQEADTALASMAQFTRSCLHPAQADESRKIG
jgi:epsilon-lactone hydrolase